jgi:hypothetical protein
MHHVPATDHPAYGDRRADRRTTRRGRDRRATDYGKGRIARKGDCRECGNETDSVVTWSGKVVYLCPPCGRAIRES